MKILVLPKDQKFQEGLFDISNKIPYNKQLEAMEELMKKTIEDEAIEELKQQDIPIATYEFDEKKVKEIIRNLEERIEIQKNEEELKKDLKNFDHIKNKKVKKFANNQKPCRKSKKKLIEQFCKDCELPLCPIRGLDPEYYKKYKCMLVKNSQKRKRELKKNDSQYNLQNIIPKEDTLSQS